jgi:hypothetical protein
MENAQAPSVRGAQPIPQQPLMKPDGLQKTLRRRILPIAKTEHGAAAQTPFSVSTALEQPHLAVSFLRSRQRSQARDKGECRSGPLRTCLPWLSGEEMTNRFAQRLSIGSLSPLYVFTLLHEVGASQRMPLQSQRD